MSQFKEFEDVKKPSREERAAKLRAEMPNAYALVDELRGVFGDVQEVTMLQEGLQDGSPRITSKNYVPDEETRYLNAGQYQRLGELIKRDEVKAAEKQAKDLRNGR